MNYSKELGCVLLFQLETSTKSLSKEFSVLLTRIHMATGAIQPPRGWQPHQEWKTRNKRVIAMYRKVISFLSLTLIWDREKH